MPITDLILTFKWWFIFLLIGISFLPITSKLFSNFLDKGYVFSKILGLLFISYTIFILSSLHILKFNQINLLLVWVLLLIPQALLLKNKKLFERKDLKLFFIEEIIFLFALFFWAWIKGFNPDIHDLEKYMDFGFVNSILRSEYFPPRDMWLTPLSINYYYFGHLFTAVATKISDIPSLISFNLMLATIFAFTFSMSFSIGINLISKIKKFSLIKASILGLLFSYIVSFAGNLQTLYAFFAHYESEYPKPIWELALSLSSFPNSYWYPSATRFIYHTIHEFPLYSFVVADLHGHVLDIPVVLTMIALFLMLTIKQKITYPITLLIGFLLSIAYMTNAWDGLIYMGLSLIFIFIINLLNQTGNLTKKVIDTILKSIKPTLLLLISFFGFSFIFNRNFDPFASGIGLNCSPNFLVKIGKIGPLIFEDGFCQVSPIWTLLILYGFFIFMIISLMIFLLRKKILISDLFVLIISIFSFLLILAPEIIYLKDIYTGHFRANTMFKLAYQAFIMLSISSVYALVRILSSIRENKNKSTFGIAGYIVFIIIGSILIFLVAIYPYFAIPSGYGNLKTYKGLDGLKYLEIIKPEDYRAIIWINNNIKDQPVILEAQGDSYTDFARISSNTGLPTVLGWTVHEWLWRGSYDIPASRFNDIQNLYETTDLNLARNIIKKYNIKYIYSGVLEKEKYKITEDKFFKLGKLIYSDGGTAIFEIN